MNIGTSLKTISKNQLCSFIGTGGYVELEETDVLSAGSLVTAAAALPLLNSGDDKRAGVLPPGYQKMEYLESSGTQYMLIDEPYQGTTTECLTGVQIKVTFLQDGLAVWGIRNNNVQQQDLMCTYTTGGVRYVATARSQGGGPYARLPYNTNPFICSYNYKQDGALRTQQGADVAERLNYTPNYTTPNLVWNYMPLFCTLITQPATVPNQRGRMQVYYAQFTQGSEITRDLIPALDTDGTPCMFDTVKKQPFYNKGTGEFRVGIATLQQVRELQLPDNTGNAVKTLYLSLPQEARTDFTAQKHLSDLAALNWSINTQYRDGDVPADYTKVDFLESTGTQYIATGILLSLDGVYQIDYQTFPQNKAAAMYVFGAHGEDLIFAHGEYGTPAPTTQFSFDWVGQSGNVFQFNGASTLRGTRLTVQLSSGSVKILQRPEFQYTVGGDKPTPISENLDIILFGANYPTRRLFSHRIFEFVHENDVLGRRHRFIPAINPSGVPGMWDKVSKQFFENAGTGAFIAGIKTLNDVRMLNNALPVVPSGSTYSITLSLPVEASTDAPAQKALQDLAARGWSINVQYREDEIPAGYAKVSFLESSASQWIDTGFIPNGNTRFRVDCKSGWNNTCVFFNAEDAYRRVAFGLINLYIYNIFEVRYNNTVYSFPQYLTLDRFVAEFSDNVVTINGTQVATIPYQDYSCNYTLFLFANHRGGSQSDVHYVIIYSAKFWDQSTGEAIRDFIPVINTAGVPGMWDRVNKQFYENAGTGQFRVGLASKEAVRNLYLEPNVAAGTTINLSVPAGTTTEDTNILKANNPNYTFNIRYRS